MAAGSIQIDVLANTQKLVSGMYKAEKTINKSVKNMTKVVYGFAAVFVTGTLINRINQASKALDSVGKTSSKLGIAAERVQELHLAAELAGISTQTMDMAVQRMTRRVAEAAKGTGEAVGALNELGISAEKLSRMTPDEMLRQIADSMSDVTNESDRVRLAMKLFDSEGVAMVNMLSAGSKGLDDVAAKANKLGLIIGGDYIKAVEKSNNAWNIASQVLGTAEKGISVGLSMSLESLVTNLTNGASKVDVFSEALNLTLQVVYGAGRGFEILSSTISTAVAGYKTLNAWLKATNGIKTDEEKVKAWENYYTAVYESETALKKMIGAMDGTSATSMALKRILDAQYSGLNTEKVNEDINKTNADLAKGTTLWGEVSVAAQGYYSKLSNNTTKANTLISGLNTTISSGITGAFRQAMDGASSFSDTFQNLIKDIIAQLINVLVVQQAVAASLRAMGIGAAVSGATTGGGGTVGVSGALASGGVTKSGGSYLVGEHGAEIVTLPKSANVTPNGDIGKVGGSTSVNVNVINNAGANVSVDDRNGEIDIIIDTIANGIQRGTNAIGGAIESRYNLSKA